LTNFLKICLTPLLGVLLVTSPVLAQKKQPPKQSGDQVLSIQIPFAVLDVQKILRSAKAVKSIRDQITAYGTAFEKEIEKEREKLRKGNQELARQRTILAPEAFAEKRREFEQQVVEVQRMVQKRQRDLDKSRTVAMAKVNKSYIDIVTKLANERELFMIIRKGQTAFANPSLDVTKEVLDLLNKKQPTVKVEKPGK
jgi:Skp family chaperone for outer membrane proteins